MKEETKLCVIPDYCGELPIRGGIHAPIHSPSKFTIKELITLLNYQIKVYEVNSKNKNDWVLLTFHNVNTYNFRGKKPEKWDALRKSVKSVAKPPQQTSMSQTPVVSDRNSNVKADTTVSTSKENAMTIEEVVRPDFI